MIRRLLCAGLDRGVVVTEGRVSVLCGAVELAEASCAEEVVGPRSAGGRGSVGHPSFVAL